MRHALAPAFLCALRLLLPLACGWGHTVTALIWRNPAEFVHLFTSDSHVGYYLQISPNGQVDGAEKQNMYSTLVIKNLTLGIVKFVGVKTEFKLCMHSNGQLFGTASFNKNDCAFKLHVLKNLYVYESVKHKFLVSLGKVKGTLVPSSNLPAFSQFSVRKNEVPLDDL